MPRTNLKVFRVKQHLTQTEMAEKIGGYRRQTYAAIENGLRDGRQKFWLDLQKAFDLPAYAVLEFMKNEPN